MTGRVIALAGNISAGKTTLATAFEKGIHGAIKLSSDDIRRDLGGFRKNDGAMVFKRMTDETDAFVKQGRIVVLDSTGMSPRYLKLVKELRETTPLFAIELRCGSAEFQEREAERTDREKLGLGVYDHSLSPLLEFDARINTTYYTPQQVYQRVLDALILAHFI